MAPATVNMAIPAVQAIGDCADYKITLEPFISQLRPLAPLVRDCLTDPSALKQLYLDTNPFISGLAISLFLSPFFLFFANVNQNWSQIDRVWSILPTLYNAHWAIWAHLAGLSTARLDLRLFVSVVWSSRLTFNYWRRGGYKIGSEDYRWAIIKDYIGQPAFFILDLCFIALIQNILLFLVTSPSYVSLLQCRVETANNTRAITTLDYFFAGTILYLIGQTAVADQQQWNYHEAKQKYQKTAKIPAESGFTAEELERGFRTSGLWAYSRHPNFVSEQCIWWTFYLWSSVVAGSPLNYTIAGPIIYSLVFVGSTPITEYISSSKYPEYKEYRKQVGMFLPKSFSKPRFSSKASPQKKRITDGSPEAAKKNAEDYAQAKKRYNLR